jgi:8-oxo-dGTP pyrophosphatase MutT (NUDIX family)
VEAAAQGGGGRLGLTGEVVRAAGAVVWRRPDGSVEVLLVHRPKYDDWSFPKGKCVDGESDEDCAVREVEEETGLQVSLEAELASTSYVSKGGPKRVRYWLAESQRPDDARPQNEVDEVAWLPTEDAASRLTYARDLDVLRSVLERLER